MGENILPASKIYVDKLLYLTSQQKRTVVNCPNPAEISGLPSPMWGRAHGERAPPVQIKKECT